MKFHNIKFTETNQGEKTGVDYVKDKRNCLAHGIESFDLASRDYSSEDLEEIMDEVFTFVNDVLNGMCNYYNNKNYKTI
jgi:hypothetical protein